MKLQLRRLMLLCYFQLHFGSGPIYPLLTTVVVVNFIFMHFNSLSISGVFKPTSSTYVISSRPILDNVIVPGQVIFYVI